MPCLSASPERSTPGPLPYHMAKTPCDLGAGMRLDLLRAEHGGRGEVLVDRGQELDPVLRQPLLRLPQLEVEPAQRRAAIARDEAAGGQPRLAVAAGLVEQDPRQRLRAGQEHPPRGQGVAVGKAIAVEAEARRGHGGFPCGCEASIAPRGRGGTSFCLDGPGSGRLRPRPSAGQWRSTRGRRREGARSRGCGRCAAAGPDGQASEVPEPGHPWAASGSRPRPSAGRGRRRA